MVTNRAYNYITVSKSNMPVYTSQTDCNVPMGVFVDTPSDNKSNIGGDVAKVHAQDMFFPNFSMRRSEGYFERDAVLLNTSAEGTDLLGSCLFLKGSFRSLLHTQQEGVVSYEGTQNFKFDPQNEFRHLIQAQTSFNLIHFSLSPDYFLQFLPESEAWAGNLKRKIIGGERILGERAAYISQCQKRALDTVFNCPLTGKLGEMMIETAIIQIVLLQLHALFKDQPQAEAALPGKKDMDLMQNLREYLATTFLDDHSLGSLAKHFGTNSNKLITLFKKAFGKSIFEYISDLKMDHARQLLLDDGHRVNEISRLVGFKNPNHFSAAFKKKYGVKPSQVK